LKTFNDLKNILNSVLSKDEMSRIDTKLDQLKNELDVLTFLNDRNEKENRINTKFIQNTVSQLELKNNELERKNNSLRDLNLQLVNSNEELERFAHLASHDLKTPLQNIIRFSQYLKKLLAKNQEKKINEALDLVVDSGKQMNDLINGILEFSKLSNQNIDKSVLINTNELIRKIKDSIFSFLDENNCTINVQANLPRIKYNYSKIYILFKNLIENAIKYNKSDIPTVNIFSVQKDDSIEFNLVDNGLGIDEQYFETIFVMFKRLHTKSDYSGSGLGLSTCKKIVEEIGGTISLESEIGKGSVFTVKIPLEFIELLP
jgi:light-regulated signal transduction histidine kinase (bacteriophytochrome)